MYISYISIFPEMYKNFLETSLIKKAVDKKIINYEVIDPRGFCDDKHKQIDDEIYG
jgi:tRNA (guanine37-N1)-methyltransferase